MNEFGLNKAILTFSYSISVIQDIPNKQKTQLSMFQWEMSPWQLLLELLHWYPIILYKTSQLNSSQGASGRSLMATNHKLN